MLGDCEMPQPRFAESLFVMTHVMGEDYLGILPLPAVEAPPDSRIPLCTQLSWAGFCTELQEGKPG